MWAKNQLFLWHVFPVTLIHLLKRQISNCFDISSGIFLNLSAYSWTEFNVASDKLGYQKKKKGEATFFKWSFTYFHFTWKIKIKKSVYDFLLYACNIHDLARVKARSADLCMVLLCGWQRLRHLSHYMLSPRVPVSSKLALKQRSGTWTSSLSIWGAGVLKW